MSVKDYSAEENSSFSSFTEEIPFTNTVKSLIIKPVVEYSCLTNGRLSLLVTHVMMMSHTCTKDCSSVPFCTTKCANQTTGE